MAERILGYNVKMGFWQFVPGIYSPFTKSSVQWNFEKSCNLAKLRAIFFLNQRGSACKIIRSTTRRNHLDKARPLDCAIAQNYLFS